MDTNYSTDMDCMRLMAEFTEAIGNTADENDLLRAVKGIHLGSDGYDH